MVKVTKDERLSLLSRQAVLDDSHCVECPLRSKNYLKRCVSCPVYQELREIGRRLGEDDDWEITDDNKTRRKSKYDLTDEELKIMKDHGISEQTARRRMQNGMTRERAIRLSPDTRRTWTPDEDVKMIQLLASGKTYKQAAKKLKRSLVSVERRASRLRRGEVEVNL